MLVIGLSGLIYRGGIQKIPTTSAIAFYSQNNTENFASVNKLQFLLDSYLQAKSIKKHIPTVAPTNNISSIRNNLPNKSFLNTTTPNIVLIILEGIPFDVLNSVYAADMDIPNLKKLHNNSYSFENMYASGFRTDQGLASLLSGIPAYPYINLLKDIEEIGAHPSILKSVKSKGYHTSFHYGGDSQFSQMKKYLLSQKVDYIMDEDHFSKKDKNMDWGVPDHILFAFSSNYILSQTEPFFSTILTSSTHLPFDYPGHTNTSDRKKNFIGSVEYLDNALGSFVDLLSSELDNTLFIITADHGCLYLGHDFNDHNRFKVPFLMFGDVVQDSLKGTKNYNYFNSHDLPNTLEHLLDFTPSDYPLSSNMTTKDSATSAYWITEHTMGWVTKSQSIVTNHDCSSIYSTSSSKSSTEKEVENLSKYYQSTLQYLHSLDTINRNLLK